MMKTREGYTSSGIDIKDMKVFDLRSMMGNVNQEAILFNDTFYNNITFGVTDATKEQVEEAARIAQMHTTSSWLRKTGTTPLSATGGAVSREATPAHKHRPRHTQKPAYPYPRRSDMGLRHQNERFVQELSENLMKNRTTLVIAHRLSTIKDADLICVMHDGEIVESGRHEELIKLNGYYKHLVDMQQF